MRLPRCGHQVPVPGPSAFNAGTRDPNDGIRTLRTGRPGAFPAVIFRGAAAAIDGSSTGRSIGRDRWLPALGHGACMILLCGVVVTTAPAKLSRLSWFVVQFNSCPVAPPTYMGRGRIAHRRIAPGAWNVSRTRAA